LNQEKQQRRAKPISRSNIRHASAALNWVLSLTKSVRLLGWEISPSQGHYLYRQDSIYTQNKRTHALNGVRTHDPSLWAGEDSSCLISRGHRDIK
jgi:hypothetical protein